MPAFGNGLAAAYRRVCRVLLLALLPACAAIAAPQARPVTVDDVLSIAMLGDAQFSPDGEWLAYNLVPPYDQLQDYSYWLYASGLSGHQLWVMRPASDAAPQLQPGLDPRASLYLAGFSPNGKHVVVLEHRMGHLRFVACRIGENACARFDAPPDIRDGNFVGAAWNERLVWTSAATFVMPVRGPDQPGSGLYSRALTGAYLWQAWETAWAGKAPTASEVISTGRDRSGDMAPGDLMEFDVETGTARLLAEGRYAGVRASPDGSRLAAARVSERDRPPPDAVLTRPATHPLFDRRYALTLINAASGEVRTMTTPWTVDPHSLTWSAGGTHLAVYGWERGETSAEGRFYVLDTAALAAERREAGGLTLEPNDTRNWQDGFDWAPGPARAVLLDKGLAVVARSALGGRADWYLLPPSGAPRNLTAALGNVSPVPLYADAASLTLLADDGPYRITAEATRRALAPAGLQDWRTLLYTGNAAHGWVNEFRFLSARLRPPLAAQGALLASDAAAGGDGVMFFDYPAAGEASWLPTEVPGGAVIAASRAASAAILSVREGAATRLLLVRAGHAPRELARINTHLAVVAPPETQNLDFLLSDPEGRAPPRRIETCLLLPPAYVPGQRYPVLVDVYPGTAPERCDSLRDAPRPAGVVKDLWAARGFIYFRPSIPLDLARTDDGPIDGMDEVVAQSVDALVEAGLADPRRIVLYGISQGGVSALHIAAQSDRYAAVISMHGWADFFSHYFGAKGINRHFHLDQNGGDNRWRYDCALDGPNNYCPFGFGATALDDPELYARSSPVAQAGNINAPVMLVHSDLDYFDMAQYDEMFGALYRSGKAARYVRYWGEGHGLSSPANIRDLWQRIDAFLAETGVMAQAGPDQPEGSPP